MRLGREKRQKIKVLEVSKDSSHTEQSSYWDDANKRGSNEGRVQEHVLSNPDILQENEAVPSTPQLLMGEAVEHLQGRQRECYLLTMRAGKSFAEVAEILGIGKGRVQQYRERAIKFIKTLSTARRRLRRDGYNGKAQYLYIAAQGRLLEYTGLGICPRRFIRGPVRTRYGATFIGCFKGFPTTNSIGSGSMGNDCR